MSRDTAFGLSDRQGKDASNDNVSRGASLYVEDTQQQSENNSRLRGSTTANSARIHPIHHHYETASESEPKINGRRLPLGRQRDSFRDEGNGLGADDNDAPIDDESPSDSVAVTGGGSGYGAYANGYGSDGPAPAPLGADAGGYDPSRGGGGSPYNDGGSYGGGGGDSNGGDSGDGDGGDGGSPYNDGGSYGGVGGGDSNGGGGGGSSPYNDGGSYGGGGGSPYNDGGSNGDGGGGSTYNDGGSYGGDGGGDSYGGGGSPYANGGSDGGGDPYGDGGSGSPYADEGYSSVWGAGGTSSTSSPFEPSSEPRFRIPSVSVGLLPAALASFLLALLGMLTTARQLERRPEGTFANCCRVSLRSVDCVYGLVYNLYHCRLGDIPQVVFASELEEDEYTDEEIERMKLRPGIEKALDVEHRKALRRVGIEMNKIKVTNKKGGVQSAGSIQR